MKRRNLKVLALIMTVAMLVSVFAGFSVMAEETVYDAATATVFQIQNPGDTEASGAYTLSDAVTAVEDGGTIKMTQDVTFTSRVDLSKKDKNYTIDGSKADESGNYTWTHSVSGNSAIKVGGANKTVTLQNLNVVTTTGCQIFQTTDGVATNLVLGKALIVTGSETFSSYWNGIVMFCYGSTVTLDGAQFNIEAPALACWNSGTGNLILKSGRLSNTSKTYGINATGSKTTSAVSICNNIFKCNVTIEGNMSEILVNDYRGAYTGAKTLRTFNEDDIVTTNGVNYTYGENTDFTSETIKNPLKVFSVGGTAYTFADAMTAVTAGETITMVDDIETFTRISNYTAKNVTIDGDGHKWTHSASASAIRFNGNGYTYTVKNVNFHTTTGNQIVETQVGTTARLILEKGVIFTAADGVTHTQGVVMAGRASTVDIKGAEFNVAAPTIATWETGDVTINLYSGTLSNGISKAAFFNGHGTTNACTVNIYGTRDQLKIDPNNAGTLRSLNYSDFTTTNTTFVMGEETDYVIHDFADYGTNVFAVGEETGLSLSDAVGKVAEGGTITMTDNAAITSHIRLSVDKNFTLDGSENGYTIVDRVSSGIFRLQATSGETEAHTMTVENVNFYTSYYGGGNDCMIFLADANIDQLVLGEGTTVTMNADSWGAGSAVMFGGGTLTIDGAVFDTPVGASVSWWGSNTRTLNLKSGTLSAGGGKTAIISGNDGVNSSTTVVGSGALSVKDYNGDTVATRTLTPADIANYDSAAAKTWYAKIDGSDVIYATIQDAVDAATDNDTILVYSTDIAAPVAITGKTLTLKGGANAQTVWTGTTAGLILHNANVTVENLQIWTTSQDVSAASNSTVMLGNTALDTEYTGSTLILNDGAMIRNSGNGVSDNSGGNCVTAMASATAGNWVYVNTGATILGNGTAIKADGNSMNLTINGGTVTSTQRTIVMDNKNNVEGGFSIIVNSGELKTIHEDGTQYLMKTYGATVDVQFNGGTISTTGGQIWGVDTGKATITFGNAILKIGGNVVYDGTDGALQIPTISNNYMYLYIDENKTTAGSGLAFAAKVNGVNDNETITVTYGMLMCPEHVGTDLTVKNGKAENPSVLMVVDPALTANGYIDTAVIGLGEKGMSSAMRARAFVTIEINLGGAVWTKTAYGEEMGATANEFARAYMQMNSEIDTETQAVVDYFLANGVVNN